MNKKALKDTMIRLYPAQFSNNDESYSELWKAVNVLVNLGLLDDSYMELMVKTDNKLYELEYKLD